MPPEPTTAPSQTSYDGTNPRLGLALVVISAAQLMVVLDATIVNVALPSIHRALHFSIADLVWVTTAYSLTFGGLLLFGGRTGDLYGRRRMFMVGIGLFAVASLLGGLATTSIWLVLARALQGVGGAIAAPTALSLITTNFPEGKPRNRAMGVYAAMAGAGSAVGLLAGGVLTDIASWRWVLFVNVPIAALVLFLTPRALRESEPGSGRLDVPGALTATAGMALLVYGLINAATHSWASASTVATLAVAAVLLVSFVVIERRTPHALMPLRIFSKRDRSASYLVMLFVAAALFAMFFFLTQYLQNVKGYSPLKTGLAFLPLSGLIGIGAQTASALVGRIGVRPLLLVGTAGATTGLGWLSQISVSTTYLGLIVPLGILALGMGLAFVPLTLTAVQGVSRGEAGLASALLNSGQQVGGAIGLSVLSTVAVTATRSKLAAVHGQGAHGMKVALTHGYADAFGVGAALALTAFLVVAAGIRVGTPAQPAEAVELAPAAG
ncbi:MAG: MFS transporter [Acidimicrobiales bacterium]